MDKIIQKFSIWTNISRSRYNSSTFKDTSILQNYDFISNLNRNMNSNVQRNMILRHPKLKMIQINNKQDWDFLIENNIINECIENIIINKEKNIRRNILKINYANKINNYSFEKFITLLLNFIKSRKDVLTDFNFYIINDLLKLKDLQEKAEKNEENILSQEMVENKTNFESDLFLQNLENKFNEIKEMKKLYDTKSDIYFEKKFDKNSNTTINTNNMTTQSDLYSKDKDNNIKSVFNIYKSSPDYYKIDSKNGNLFGMQNREEYYNGIDGFKDELKKLLKIY